MQVFLLSISFLLCVFNIVCYNKAFEICTRNRLKLEIENYKKILLDNGYPEDVIKQQILQTTAWCPLYLMVSWMSDLSTKLSSGIKAAVDNCFASVNLKVIFTSKRILPIGHKDIAPAIKKSNVIYKF